MTETQILEKLTKLIGPARKMSIKTPVKPDSFLKVYCKLVVVKGDVDKPFDKISLDLAKRFEPKSEIGDELVVKLSSKEFFYDGQSVTKI